MDTPRKLSTKERLIEVGTALVWKNGYNDTGIQEILKLSGAPKGSFYHHFGSKEDFGLQILDTFAEQSRQKLEEHLQTSEQSPYARIESFFREQRDVFSEKGCQDGCLIGNLGQELAGTNDIFRRRVEKHMGAVRAALASCLAQAVEQGETQADPEDLADVLFSSWHGALLRMKVQQSIDPVDRFLRIYFPKTN